MNVPHRMKDEALKFPGEPAGEFMTVVPVEHASKGAGSAARKKQPLVMKIKYPD